MQTAKIVPDASVLVYCYQLYEGAVNHVKRFFAGEENKSRLGNTGWSLMVKTLLEHMTALPNSVLSGLALLSELIPLPLPIMCPSLPVKDGELRFIRENRARWGVSVMPHCKMLSQMLSVLMNSASSQLSTVVKRIACQVIHTVV